MTDPLEGIKEQVGRRNFDSPPLHLWNPTLSGDIAIRIAADGSWYHEGTKIQRESLVRLFASILRREDDDEYYLVTPVEKWRISVELHPLVVTDVSAVNNGEGKQILEAVLNTGKAIPISPQHPLFLEQAVGGIPALTLDHGLTALLTRAAWYRLADMASDESGVPTIVSGEYRLQLKP